MKIITFSFAPAKIILLAALMLPIAVIAQTPLAKYIKDNKYEPFTIPRTQWGVGTSITFKKGSEVINALNNDCLKLTGETSSAFIPNQSYTITSGNSFELNLGKLFGDKLNINAAFKNTRVKKVVITIKEAEETVIPTIAIKQKIINLAKEQNTLCLDATTAKNNVIIIRTLSIGSLAYSFLDDKGLKITLNANFLKDLKMADSVARKFEGKTELTISERAFIGYRVSQFKPQAGMTQTTVRETLLEPAIIKDLKIKSMKK